LGAACLATRHFGHFVKSLNNVDQVTCPAFDVIKYEVPYFVTFDVKN